MSNGNNLNSGTSKNVLYDYDPENSTGDVPSPCIGICKMDQVNGWCAGCFRTIPELTGWSTASNDIKRQIWMQVKERMFA